MPDATYVALANRLVYLRTLRHWTRAELARRSGVPQHLIEQLEHLRRDDILLSRVVALARALDTTVRELLTELPTFTCATCGRVSQRLQDAAICNWCDTLDRLRRHEAERSKP